MMKIKQLLTVLLAMFFLVSGSLVASVAQETKNRQCAENDITVRCILINAETTVSLIDDPFNYATSAVELAIAQDSHGNTDRTWELFDQAIERADSIEDNARKETAMTDIALALSKVKENGRAIGHIATITRFIEQVGTVEKKQDINGKLMTALAVHGDAKVAFENALALQEGNPTLDSFKARTIREVSAKLAKKGDFDDAIAALDEITMGLTYYKSMAHSDIATEAVKQGRADLVPSLLSDASVIARAQDNGYFVAGALRDIGFSYAVYGDAETANNYFNEAIAGSRNANSYQEKARSMSRIATRMADAGMTSETASMIAEATDLAGQEESELFQQFSLYEIAGSAAFCGHFDTAQDLIEKIPSISFSSTASLKNSTIRDLAWGMAKHGDFVGAVKLANTIETKRERVQTLSRIARVIVDPKMAAIARYL